MKNNKILKGAGVLLIATILISSVVAMADTQQEREITASFNSTNNSDSLQNELPETSMAILWDNGAPTANSNLLASQHDPVYPFISQTADDFLFEENTEITDVHWWGGFWNGPPDEVDPLEFNIFFYADDGTGGAPTGGGLPDPSPTALATYNFASISGKPVNPDGFYEYNVDLDPPFTASGGEKHWIAIQAVFAFQPQWGWASTTGIKLAPAVQGFPLIPIPFWTLSDPECDVSYYLTGGDPVIPDLDCDGDLNWVDIEPGANVSGNFVVVNVGDPTSLLNWKIDSWPTWGNWTFTPISGTNLKPADGAFTVLVDIEVPNEQNQVFTGSITIVNTDDTTDTCTISVSLATPISHQVNNFPLLQRILELFPNAFPILRNMLGM